MLLALIACAPSFQDLEPQQIKNVLDNKEQLGLFVLNVHTPYEGNLEGTDAIIEDWQNIKAHEDKLPANKATPLLVYCRSGRMSMSAVEQLRELGYSDIYHLKGGMKAWDAAGFEVLEKKFE